MSLQKVMKVIVTIGHVMMPSHILGSAHFDVGHLGDQLLAVPVGTELLWDRELFLQLLPKHKSVSSGHFRWVNLTQFINTSNESDIVGQIKHRQNYKLLESQTAYLRILRSRLARGRSFRKTWQKRSECGEILYSDTPYNHRSCRWIRSALC